MTEVRFFGTPGVPGPYHDLAPSRVGAQEAEQRAIREVCAPKLEPSVKREVPTFAEWFKGSFWQAWWDHKRIDETMLYVHVTEAHHRELPEIVREKARGVDDPDQRVLAMLGARGSYVAAAASEKKEVRQSA